MQIQFKVTTTDGASTDVQTSYGDLIALENKFNINASDLGVTQRAQWLAFLAYSALKRRGDVKVSFEEWTETVISLEPVNEDAGNA